MNSAQMDCSVCRPFHMSRTFETPDDYREFVRQLMDACEKQEFAITRADAPLASMLTDPWPNFDDTFVHEFSCTHCQRIYQLYVNVWSGRNWWQPDKKMPA